jgi:hypothetical protein
VAVEDVFAAKALEPRGHTHDLAFEGDGVLPPGVVGSGRTAVAGEDLEVDQVQVVGGRGMVLGGELVFGAGLGALGPLVPVLNKIVLDGSLLVAVLLFGDAMRSHRALMAEAADRLRRAGEDREREARELSAARVIQQQLLPKEMPSLPRWRVAAYYQPARAVGGDFYDFLEMPDGQVAIVTGDVTDKGIPAALVMATTHSILRGDAPGSSLPARCSSEPTIAFIPTSPRSCS